jgi:transcriptional regulator with PAS, ATPase and Fis domain
MRTPVTRIQEGGMRPRLFRKKFRLEVLSGPDARRSVIASHRVTVGSSAKNDLALTDSAVSRHHLRIEPDDEGFVVSDLGSTNGTSIGTTRVREVVVADRVDIRVGDTVLRFEPLAEEEEILLLEDDHFGDLLGKSPAMRELFLRMESIASKDVTVLVEGETGTGKELIAREIHARSPRQARPFVVVDCGAIPPTLIESELFGHERGAFTHAVEGRPGAFEEADGGTVFLDEIGELELPMQPKLLRVLERGEVKRVGASQHRRLDLRVIAATNRDLERAVNAGTFRADLFYRLAVVHLRVPPLRHRPEDVELLVGRMLASIASSMAVPAPELSSETMQQLVSHPWPGNVRELRNFLERLVALSDRGAPELSRPLELSSRELTVADLESLPFRDAKARWIEHFDVTYLSRLLLRHGNNVADAARHSGIDRVHLFRLIKKYKLERR